MKKYTLFVALLSVSNSLYAVSNRYGMTLTNSGGTCTLTDSERICNTIDCVSLPANAYEPNTYSENSIKAIDPADVALVTVSNNIFNKIATADQSTLISTNQNTISTAYTYSSSEIDFDLHESFLKVLFADNGVPYVLAKGTVNSYITDFFEEFLS